MGGQFIKILKFGFLFVIAFAVPKMITESGHYFRNLDKMEQRPQKTETPAYENNSVYNRLNEMLGSKQYNSTMFPNDSTKSNTFFDNQTKDFKQSHTSQFIYRSPVTPINKIIRFDRNPNWIMNLWNRVDTVQTSSFLGYRVAALTGTEKDDLAGVLTYYFDNNQMRQIHFHGKTGDYSKILTFLQRYFGMVRLEKESTANQFVYEATLRDESSRERARRNDKSRLFIRPKQMFLAQEPNDRFEIEFQLNAP